MTLNDLTVKFDHLDSEWLLSDWDWLIGKNKVAILLSAAGDAFLQDTRDGTIHLLDVAAGEINQVASDLAEFQSLLTDKKFVGDHFAVQMVGDLRLDGIVLEHGKIYSFIKPPVLGGEYSLNNIEVADIAVHFSINGQIHHQVRDLPPGTPIANITVSNTAAHKKWWKFWS